MLKRTALWCGGVLAATAGSLLSADAPAAESEPAYSRIVHPGPDGRLVNVPDERGNVIIDFSHCGYMGGGVAIPEPPVRVTLDPAGPPAAGEFRNDLPRIRAAINAVRAMPRDENGFRGAVLLRRGTWFLHGTLNIADSGIVLRGEGSDQDGTILVATLPERHSVIVVSGAGRAEEVAGTRQPITDDYIPAGARTFTVADPSGFAVGDKVTVHRPSTAEWLADLKMDRLTETYNNPRLTNWKPGDYDMRFRRQIVAIEGSWITIDVPLAHSLDQQYGGGFLYRHENPGQIRQVGVERLRIVSDFDRSKIRDNPGDVGDRAMRRYIDTDHAWIGVELNNVRDAWVRDVRMYYVGYAAVQTGRESMFITAMDVAQLDPVAPTTSPFKYSFNVTGQMGLFLRCYSRNARHDFVLGSRVVGPNAFVDCRAEEVVSASEPHHRYSVGCLWDNVTLYGDGLLLAVNRGNSGSGHGWAGANMVFWNSGAESTVVMQPPGAQNYSIGRTGPPDRGAEAHAGILRWVHTRSTKEFHYDGSAVMGDGHIEHPTGPVEPRSLYFKQLEDRLGPQAVTAFEE